MTIDEIAGRIEGARRKTFGNGCDGYTGRCPAHDDRNPSFAVWEGKDGWLHFKCQAGCNEKQILDALGMANEDRRIVKPKPGNTKITIEAVYQYRDETGKVLFEAVRYNPKDFKQRRPNGKGGWIYQLGDTRRVLYRLPEVVKALETKQHIYICEGEKDADAVATLGLCATCNPMGAGSWQKEYSAVLSGVSVTVIADKDKAGYSHAQKVRDSLGSVGCAVRVVEAKEGKDAYDHISAGYGIEDFQEVEESRLSNLKPEPTSKTRIAPRNEYAFTTIGELIEEPEEQIPYIVEGLLPRGGLSILGAKPKVGKSTLARYLAFCVARGTPFLGLVCEQGSVIYLALEEKRSELQRIFKGMGAEKDDPIHIHVGMAPYEALSALIPEIERIEPILIIVDTLFKFARVQDGNDYAKMSAALEPIIEMARTSGANILCTHHMGKADREGGDGLIGSTAIFGAPDTMLTMRKSGDKRVLSSIQRYGTDMPETVIALDLETNHVTINGTLADVQKDESTKQILLLLDKGDELTEPEIKAEIGGNQSHIGKALRDLIKESKLVRRGTGRKGEPYRYSKCLVSQLSIVGNQENQETEKAAPVPLKGTSEQEQVFDEEITI